jgi:hypothetical protein
MTQACWICYHFMKIMLASHKNEQNIACPFNYIVLEGWPVTSSELTS